MIMTHPGLPEPWGYLVWGFMLALGLWSLIAKVPMQLERRTFSLDDFWLSRPLVRFMLHSPWLLRLLKLVVVALFLLVIIAGLYGTPIAGRNLATVLTWNIWWAGLIVSIFFLGSAWCAVCPWDTLASWMVRPRLWFGKINNSLDLKVPRYLRSVWPALLMFIGLTWLELGVGVTTSPYATALLSLLMVVLATLAMALFKNKAFCRYICPVGRTVGFYAQLAPVELRPIKPDVCAACTTLECYNGSDSVDPCPTQLVMGTLTQNTYCTSCGNCARSCPQQNVSWRLRPPSHEAVADARPHWDEAWFMLGLLALTAFHGLTMMPFWEQWMSALAQKIGDSGQLLASFSIGLMLSLLLPALLYALTIFVLQRLNHKHVEFRALFTGMAFVTLPLAFAYHIAHNLNHLVREGVGLAAMFLNPLGIGLAPLSMAEKHQRHFDMLMSQDLLFTLQGLLMMFGFWIAIKVLRHRGQRLLPSAGWRLLPVLIFIIVINGFHLWLLMQPMIMRM
ncbi:Nitrogen assimilation regulatory protein [hydrothermal vent metagenome]|uniref:Nitrogen assimilation regulatory protein n=1 Tax=hydrothermal vent metagenome TaxID=652676 RepID=A0A3B1C530_9ZZZZ